MSIATAAVAEAGLQLRLGIVAQLSSLWCQPFVFDILVLR